MKPDSREEQLPVFDLYPDLKDEINHIRQSPKLSPSTKNVCKKGSADNAVHSCGSVSPQPKMESSFKYSLYRIVGFISIIIIFIFFYKSLEFKTNNPPFPKIDIILNSLKEEFHGQPDLSFRIVSAALKRVFKADPKEPAIIMLVAAKGVESKTHHLAHSLAQLVSESESYVLINGLELKSTPSSLAKKDITEKINSALNSSALNAVLIDALDAIPGETALIFHNYCDHENAKYKRAVYVMTVSSETEFKEKNNSKYVDNIVEKHLKNKWKDVNEDQISSLLSRLSVSVAAVTQK
ncbi:torsin-1A-interacting protein 1-like isoform X2 [Stegodyphus dumicola]|uniref:torsin-1A-interacting protein 1-like isoform X2 n=1 Tax=Stegodyphus dumicola TaxID=202533 RepID=UPI0015AA4035|nr:torsin-1A-interacting protein 1-like isoform X2 [Stegodyphus dumicola]